jgi:hypothetical protein
MAQNGRHAYLSADETTMNNDQPTEKQLQRIYTLLEHPSIQGEYLDSLGDRVDILIRTRKGAGVLIQILKRKTGWDGKSPIERQ